MPLNVTFGTDLAVPVFLEPLLLPELPPELPRDPDEPEELEDDELPPRPPPPPPPPPDPPPPLLFSKELSNVSSKRFASGALTKSALTLSRNESMSLRRGTEIDETAEKTASKTDEAFQNLIVIDQEMLILDRGKCQDAE